MSRLLERALYRVLIEIATNINQEWVCPEDKDCSPCCFGKIIELYIGSKHKHEYMLCEILEAISKLPKEEEERGNNGQS